jgi:hypothetical protein
MADHRLAHPEPVDGCFGCRVLGIGFQGLQSRYGSDPVETKPVVGDEGSRSGRVMGEHHVHWDGRRDAVARPPTMKYRLGPDREEQ